MPPRITKAELAKRYAEKAASPEYGQQLAQRLQDDLQAERRRWDPRPKATSQEESLLITYNV